MMLMMQWLSALLTSGVASEAKSRPVNHEPPGLYPAHLSI
jgi:hypothetical protein